jgi:hypothetical protein
LGFLVELGEDISSGDGEFGVQISEVSEEPANIAQGGEPAQLAFDSGGQECFLGRKMVVDAAGAGAEPGSLLDPGDAGTAVAVLTEQLHRCVDDAIPGPRG